ncbi:MAG: hypothetical protein ACXADY_22220 [Candidatus Hodarchaeales archaeon]|jgi:hypothetical protein
MSCFSKLIESTLEEQNRRNGDTMTCIYKLLAKNVSFCLKYKDVIFNCPTKCPFFTAGESGHYQKALQKQYDIDCLYCTRREVSQSNAIDSQKFYCMLNKQFHPFCSMCLFALYNAEPKQADKKGSYLR